MIYSLMYCGDTLGYRVETHKGVFDVGIDLLDGFDVVSYKTLELIKCSDGSFKTLDEIDTNYTVHEVNSSGAELNAVKFIIETQYYVNIKTCISLTSTVSLYSDLNKRFCLEDTKKFIGNKLDNILIFFGTRRTGKTVLMFHTIDYLLSIGVKSSDIIYMDLEEDVPTH